MAETLVDLLQLKSNIDVRGAPVPSTALMASRNRWSFVFCSILIFAVNGHCADIPAKISLTRAYAIEMAVRKNVDLHIEALNSTMSEIDTKRSWAIYNPVLNFVFNAGVAATPGDPFFTTKSGLASINLTQLLPTGGSFAANTQSGYTNAGSELSENFTSVWQSAAGLTLTQPLLKNAGKETVQLNITLAANTLQDALERFRLITTDTVLNVITSYNHLYTLRQIMESKENALKSAQDLLDEIKKKVQPGSVHDMEVANAEFAVVQRRKDLIDAGRYVSDQEASFRYLIGLPEKTQIIPIDAPSRDEPKETEVQALKTAVEERLDLQQLRLALKTSQLQERVAHHQTLPDLSINASGGVTGSGGNFGDSYRQTWEKPGTYWSAGLNFSMPLGNLAAENDYRRSKIRTEQVQEQIRALSWRIRNDVEADMRALISARLQIQMTEKALQVSEQRLAEYRKNQEAGKATLQDMINAENDFIYSRNAQLDAVESFSNGVVKLWRDMGVLLDRQGIHLDTSHPQQLTEGAKESPLKVNTPAP